GLAIDQIAQSGLSSLSVIYYSAHLFSEMNPRYAHCVTLYHNGFTCEADTLGSCGYVYIAVYPTQR
ncbi:type IV toxin-antitoxin system YeeU family antitoxin, partial [Citrobacter braakii]|uniref:type IV toxin-antitoxin system YeeU family antitoxin n=1 Tax=Citrobacter braakii TaxID=57706 RepID=UPI003C301827